MPNPNARTVYLYEVLSEVTETQRLKGVMIGLGVDVVGKPFLMNLCEAPHLLVAGTTGSGQECLPEHAPGEHSPALPAERRAAAPGGSEDGGDVAVQRPAATDDWESKFSLIPLIFGTLKGAFYSLLFAIPIGVLGAIYTSEFLHPRVRGIVKPAMELMASLPSVVLGFVAALVLAPVIETWIGAVVLAFVIVPGTLILAAYLWQMLPLELGIRAAGRSALPAHDAGGAHRDLCHRQPGTLAGALAF